MWKRWRFALEPWQDMAGWQFDLLRTLPSPIARQLYRQAWGRASLERLYTWQWWVCFGLGSGLAVLSLAVIWSIAGNLGLGPFGRLGLEVAVHVTLGILCLHPLARFYEQYMLPFVASALADELLQLVEDENPVG